MTAIGPYTKSYDFTHMAFIPDIRGNKPPREYRTGSMVDILSSNPDFSKALYMLKLAKLDTIYDEPQANFTLFVPSNAAIAKIPDEVFVNMDRATARHITMSSSMLNKITGTLLEDSPASYFLTTNRQNKLFISNVNRQTYVNNCLKVIKKDIIADNGVIHVIDGLIWPAII